MCKHFIALLSVSLLLSACGAGPFVMDRKVLDGKTAKFSTLNNPLVFTEKTMGGFFAHSTATWAAGPILSGSQGAGQPAVPAADPSKQVVIASYSPLEKIAANVVQQLSGDLHWRQSESPDYEVGFSNGEWGIMYHPVNVTTYNIFYTVNMAVSEVRATHAKGPKRAVFSCRYSTDSKYSYDEVFANNAVAVESAMNEAVAACSKELIDDIRSRIASDSASRG